MSLTKLQEIFSGRGYDINEANRRETYFEMPSLKHDLTYHVLNPGNGTLYILQLRTSSQARYVVSFDLEGPDQKTPRHKIGVTNFWDGIRGNRPIQMTTSVLHTWISTCVVRVAGDKVGPSISQKVIATFIKLIETKGIPE